MKILDLENKKPPLKIIINNRRFSYLRSMIKNSKFYGRQKELDEIDEFISQDWASILFIKGRRRIGKTWLLNQIEKKYKNNVLMYSGKSTSVKKESYTLLNLIENFFNNDKKQSFLLKDIQEINPSEMFDRLIELFKSSKKKHKILILDEIQWIGNDNGKEFSSSLKEKWTKIEQETDLKIIITGSSSRYFNEVVERNEGILRGISDRAPMVLNPFSLGELKKYFFPNYSNEEIAFIHMITGGIAKYVDILRRNSINKSFLYCINKSFFVKNNLFMAESFDILTIDLSKEKSKSSTKILKEIGHNTVNYSTLIDKLKNNLSESYFNDLLRDLVDLDILGSKTLNGEIIDDLKSLSFGVKKTYYIKDPMLMFYYSVIYPQIDNIKFNEKGMLFSKDLTSDKFPITKNGFSGEAFERLVYSVLKIKNILKVPIFKKMEIFDYSFDVNCFKNKESQIDVVVFNRSDKTVKVIEAKWIGDFNRNIQDYCSEVNDKKIVIPSGWLRQNYYIYSIELSQKRLDEMTDFNVIGLTLNDLFDNPED